jgi:hypothetical protein
MESGSMKCDFCDSEDLEFSWRRKFNLRDNGWVGSHEYWYCRECGRGNFRVEESGLVLESPSKGCRLALE